MFWNRAILLTCCVANAAGPSAPSLPFSYQVQDLLGIPYVPDAVRDQRGRWTFFDHPERTLELPGLNCSGLTYAIAHTLLNCDLSPSEAGASRLGDRREPSKFKDWNFGLDLILNLSEGLPRRFLLPQGAMEVSGGSEGFPLDDIEAWAKVLPRMRQDRVYLVSISRHRGHIQHYHTAVILKDLSGTWFYQTLPGGHSHRLNLALPQGLDRIRQMFGSGKKILLLEVELNTAK